MARVFISHASRDAALAAEVHRWLVDRGNEVFLDQDLSDGLLAGEEWERQLRERLRWADAVVCVLTSAYLASVWCTAELTIAQSRGSRLLPVLAEPGVRHPLLSAIQYVDMTTDAAAARARVTEALLRVDVAGGHGWSDDRSPFPGLRPLATDESSVFFGRAREIGQLATLLRSPAERVDPAVLLVVGPSGCGKSSLVRAGLLPVMAAEEEWWTLPPILPGARPVVALARELAASARMVGLAWTVTDVRHRLDAGDLGGLVDDLLLAVPGHRRRHLLIVVDQFEELLTQTGPEERARLAELLHNGLTGALQVVATLRPEFLEPLLANSELSALPTRTHILRPLRPEALRAVIEGPADRAGISVDADLVSRLVADTGGGEALPLLAYTLAQLTDGVTRGDSIPAARYEQLGGVHGALAGQANGALADAVAAGGRGGDQVIQELLRLVTVDEQGRPTRWRIRRDELTGQVLTELQPFIDRHLLTTDTDHGHVVIAVAHEAFLSSWPPLEKAITASAAALRARRQVEQAAIEWTEHGHSPARLWERGQLAAALADTGARLQSGRTARRTTSNEEVPGPKTGSASRWPRRRRILVADRLELSIRARDFLWASIRHDRRRRGQALTVLSVLLVLALGLAALAFDRQGAAQNQQRVAEQRQRLATGRQLIAQAEVRLDRDPRTALRLNEAAVQIHDSPETRSALVNNVLATPYTGTLTGHDGPVRAVAFAPSGSLLASAGRDGTVRLWDLTDPVAPALLGTPLTGHFGTVWAVAFAPDGSLLASADGDGTVRLWDLANPATPALLGAPLTGDGVPARAVAFAPDRSLLASGGDGGAVRLWDLADPAAPTPLGAPLRGHGGPVRAVAFAPAGSLMASAGVDGAVRLWDLADPAAPTPVGVPLTGHDGPVNAVAFAPAGSLMASAGDGGAVRLWNLADPAAPTTLGAPLTGHDGPVTEVAFAPAESLLASAGDDRTVRLWNTRDPGTPTPVGAPLTGHDGKVNAVAFAPAGSPMAAAGDDGTVRLWNTHDPAAPTAFGVPFTGHGGPVRAVAFAPDQPLMASAGVDGTIRLWNTRDPATPTPLGVPLTGHDDKVNAVAFAPDGALMASAGDGGTVRLWDLADPATPALLGAPLTGHDGPVTEVAFAPAGFLMASAGDDGTVRLWNTRDPAAPTAFGVPLTGHGGPVRAVAFAPDGALMASASVDGTVRLWNLADPAPLTLLGVPLTGHDGTVRAVAFAPVGSLMASAGDDGTVRLWNLADPAAPTPLGVPLTGHDGRVRAVAFALDGSLMASAGLDGTVRLWNLADPAAPTALGAPLTGHLGTVWAVAFAPDRSLLASAGDDGVVRLWDLASLIKLRDHLMKRACFITGGGLSRSEWESYVPGIAYTDVCKT